MSNAANNISGLTGQLGGAGAPQQSAPKFNALAGLYLTGKIVTVDVDGNLWQIDAEAGSMRRVTKL